jgi:hypothetical protein
VRGRPPSAVSSYGPTVPKGRRPLLRSVPTHEPPGLLIRNGIIQCKRLGIFASPERAGGIVRRPFAATLQGRELSAGDAAGSTLRVSERVPAGRDDGRGLDRWITSPPGASTGGTGLRGPAPVDVAPLPEGSASLMARAVLLDDPAGRKGRGRARVSRTASTGRTRAMENGFAYETCLTGFGTGSSSGGGQGSPAGDLRGRAGNGPIRGRRQSDRAALRMPLPQWRLQLTAGSGGTPIPLQAPID